MIGMHTTGPKIVIRLADVTRKGKERDYRFAHVSCFHEIIFIEYGGLDLSVADDAFQLRKGDCIFISSGKAHRLRASGKAPVNYLNVNYFGRLPTELADRPFAPSPAAAAVLDRLKQVAMAEPVNAGLAELAACLVTELVLLLCWEHSIPYDSATPVPATQRLHRSRVVHTALSLIAEQHDTPLTASEVARRTGASVSHLRRLLKAETGHGFQAHLHMARVEEAKRLLLQTPDTVSAIAQRVGYASPPFFYRIFRRLTGMTPLQYARDPDLPPRTLSSQREPEYRLAEAISGAAGQDSYPRRS